MVDESASRKMFVGHEKAVTCLSVSTGGCHLLSGEGKKKQSRSMIIFLKIPFSTTYLSISLQKKKNRFG
jgi:shikimate kinase